MENLKCYICDEEMVYTETIEVPIFGGKCEKYECPKCDETIYHPLEKKKYNEGMK